MDIDETKFSPSIGFKVFFIYFFIPLYLRLYFYFLFRFTSNEYKYFTYHKYFVIYNAPSYISFDISSRCTSTLNNYYLSWQLYDIQKNHLY